MKDNKRNTELINPKKDGNHRNSIDLAHAFLMEMVCCTRFHRAKPSITVN